MRKDSLQDHRNCRGTPIRICCRMCLSPPHSDHRKVHFDNVPRNFQPLGTLCNVDAIWSFRPPECRVRVDRVVVRPQDTARNAYDKKGHSRQRWAYPVVRGTRSLMESRVRLGFEFSSTQRLTLVALNPSVQNAACEPGAHAADESVRMANLTLLAS